MLHPLRSPCARLVTLSTALAAAIVPLCLFGWPGEGRAATAVSTGPFARRSLLVKGTYRPEGGLVVNEIEADSPLRQISRANGQPGVFRVEVGDIITHINDEPIRDGESFTWALTSGPDEALLTLIDHTTGRPGRWVCRPAQYRRGLSVGLGFRPQGGAVVRSIGQGSPTQRMRPAAGAGADRRLAVGDVIVRVDGQAVDTEAALLAALDSDAADIRLSVSDRGTGAVQDWICPAVPIRLPQARTARRSAWILLVGQTDDPQLGRFIPISLSKLRHVFTEQLASDRLRFRIVDRPDCTADGILAAIRALPLAADDTLLVYYLGHGAYDPAAPADDPTGGHYFDLPTGRLTRSRLLRELQARPVRLRVLISDACNVEGLNDESRRPVQEYAVRSVEGLSATEKLLFNVRGLVDIEAASRGQYSWYGEPYGGWFTHVLVDLLPRHDNWPELIAKLRTDANDFFNACKLRLALNPAGANATAIAALRSQEAMTPFVFAADLRDDVAQADARDRSRRTSPTGAVRYVTR